MPVSIILMLLCVGISGRQVAPERLKLSRGHRPVRAMVFPVVMYGCESWTVQEAEHQRIDAFELWCWRRLLRVPWTARTNMWEDYSNYFREGVRISRNWSVAHFLASGLSWSW